MEKLYKKEIMNNLEKAEMNTAAYGFYGDKNHDREREGFKRGWENRAAYKGPGSTLPVSPAVLTKRELVAAMALQGLLATHESQGRTILGNVFHYLTETAVEAADLLLEKLGS